MNEPNLGHLEVLGDAANNPPQPSQIGDTVTSLNREWRVADLEQGIKAQYEQWIRAGAKAAIDTMQLLDAEEADQMRRVYLADFAARKYNWGGTHIRASLRDIPGVQYLFFLVLRRCQDDMTEDLARRIFENNPKGCELAMKWSLGNSKAPQAGATKNGQQRTATTTRKMEPATLDSP